MNYWIHKFGVERVNAALVSDIGTLGSKASTDWWHKDFKDSKDSRVRRIPTIPTIPAIPNILEF